MKKLAPKWKVAARIAVVIVGLDVATKLVALGSLSEDREHRVLWDSICFSLNINEDLVGYGTSRSLSVYGTPANILFAMGVFMIVGSVVLAHATKESSRPIRKFLIGAGLAIAASLAGSIAALIWKEPAIGVVASALVHGTGALAFLWVALRITKNRIVFLMLAVLASADLANFLNYLYFPKGVIDFMFFPSLEPVLGTTNIADLVMTAAKYLLIPAGAALAICGVILRVTKTPETRVGRICAWVLRAHEGGASREPT